MKERLLNGWNAKRAFYVFAGVGLVVIAALDGQWAGIMAGGYFVTMGLFAFGCAGGNCLNESCDHQPDQKMIDKINKI